MVSPGYAVLKNINNKNEDVQEIKKNSKKHKFNFKNDETLIKNVQGL